MVRKYKFVLIRNPKNCFNKEWYMERIYWRLANERCTEMIRLISIEQRLIEGQLKNEAIKDLYDYIVNSDKARKFLIYFMRVEKEDIKLGCRCKNGSWQLTYHSNHDLTAIEIQEHRANNNHTLATIKSEKLSMTRLCDFSYDINVVGITFFEAVLILPVINVIQT